MLPITALKGIGSSTVGNIMKRRIPPQPQKMLVRRSGDYIPQSQYDTPFPWKFTPKAWFIYWELTPLLACTALAISGVLFNTFWACKNKVDIVFSTHSRDNISRTMDLRRPTVHKLIIIYQRYDPWPQMQAVLDKMKEAEKRVFLRANECSYEHREGHPPAEL